MNSLVFGKPWKPKGIRQIGQTCDNWTKKEVLGVRTKLSNNKRVSKRIVGNRNKNKQKH